MEHSHYAGSRIDESIFHTRNFIWNESWRAPCISAVWASRASGVFDYTHGATAGGRFPADGTTMVHLVEDVHVQLFVAMCCYYACCAHSIVRVAVRCSRKQLILL